MHRGGPLCIHSLLRCWVLWIFVFPGGRIDLELQLAKPAHTGMQVHLTTFVLCFPSLHKQSPPQPDPPGIFNLRLSFDRLLMAAGAPAVVDTALRSLCALTGNS